MEFCLVDQNRLLTLPTIYQRAELGRALAYHGIPVDLLPDALPDEPLPLHHLQLLPVVDITDYPAECSELYHQGQPQYSVEADRVALSYPQIPYPLEYCVTTVLGAINTTVDHALLALKEGYPEQETATWTLQKVEAEAWTVDNAASVPTLRVIAERRGLALSDLVQRVLEKSTDYSSLVGMVLGDRQAAEDALSALKSADPLPDDWFEQIRAVASGWNSSWAPELLRR